MIEEGPSETSVDLDNELLANSYEKSSESCSLDSAKNEEDEETSNFDTSFDS